MSTERKQRPVKPIPDALDPAETLAMEATWLPRAGILAIIAGLLPVIGLVLQNIAARGIDNDIERIVSVGQSLTRYGSGDGGNGISGGQVQIAQHYGDQWLLVAGSGILSGLGLLLAAPVLYGLLRSAWRRRPSFPKWFFWAPVVGGVCFGLGSMIASVYGAVHYHDFAQLAADAQTNGAANDALTAARDDLTAVRLVAGLGSLATAIGLGAAALSAMNVGLLTRVIGSIGVLLAVLVVIPLVQQQDFLRAFWLIALGFTLLGRWPGGRPPAWQTGDAVPWPTRAQLIEEQERQNRPEGPVVGDAPAPRPKSSPGGSRKKRRK